ncbi:hypothetical protein HBI15_153170 [Parastagonospora nodorum]|nr:hypothetical protein HBI15_153170 [Parastagonospora nodorum]
MILEVVELIEDLISYLRNAQIPKVFYEAAYSAKVKTEDLSNTLMLTLSETAQQRSSSVVSNRSIALITDKFGVASLTELAILNDANVALVDAVHYSVVMDALMMTLIKNNDDLLGTVNSYIKLRRLRRCKTEAADSRHAKVSGGRTKKDKDLENSDTSSDVLRLRRRDRAAASQLKKTRDEEELAKAKKEKEEKEAQDDDYCLDSSSDINSKNNLEDEEATTAKDLLIDVYILYFKELLSDNSGIFANTMGMGKTQAIIEVQNAQAEGDAIEYNAVDDDDKLCPTKGERTFYCAGEQLMPGRMSDSLLENIGRLTKEEAMEMRIDTTNAISKALAAANKLVALRSYVLEGVNYQEIVYWIILEANTPAVHSKATKHCLAPLAAQFVIVCGFRKVDKHVFRAYNTISVTAQQTIIRKGGSYVEKRAILLSDILEKEGLNKLEASRRVIFNCFKMQAIASYSALTTLKAAQFKIYSSCKVKRFTLNSVKDLFTNSSKDYFLVREARAITKSSLKFQNLLNLCSELGLREKFGDKSVLVMQGGITQHEINLKLLAEMCVGIVYFNLDSELELKVLGKQDVKTTS